MEYRLRAVVIQESSFVAQMIEYDIAAQGDTINEALSNLAKTFFAELDYSQDVLHSIPKPPSRYADRFALGKTLKTIKKSHGDTGLVLTARIH